MTDAAMPAPPQGRAATGIAGLDEEAVLLASQIAATAPLAVRESLRVARAAFAQNESGLRAITREARAVVLASNDFKEGPLAFIEKRPPRWTGT